MMTAAKTSKSAQPNPQPKVHPSEPETERADEGFTRALPDSPFSSLIQPNPRRQIHLRAQVAVLLVRRRDDRERARAAAADAREHSLHRAYTPPAT